jgi:hypothetical protein
VLWQALSRDCSVLDLNGRPVPVPSKGGTALVVALHASQHGATVGHPLKDLQRALDRFEPDVWAEGAARAGECDALFAFRQGLSMFPQGAARLAVLGLEPAMSRQAALRRKGTRVPDYLFEGLSLAERRAILRYRLVPPREEMAALVDPRAAESRGRLVAAHGRRAAEVPVRSARLAWRWLHARNEPSAGDQAPRPMPTGDPSRSRGSG